MQRGYGEVGRARAGWSQTNTLHYVELFFAYRVCFSQFSLFYIKKKQGFMDKENSSRKILRIKEKTALENSSSRPRWATDSPCDVLTCSDGGEGALISHPTLGHPAIKKFNINTNRSDYYQTDDNSPGCYPWPWTTRSRSRWGYVYQQTTTELISQ